MAFTGNFFEQFEIQDKQCLRDILNLFKKMGSHDTCLTQENN